MLKYNYLNETSNKSNLDVISGVRFQTPDISTE